MTDDQDRRLPPTTCMGIPRERHGRAFYLRRTAVKDREASRDQQPQSVTEST
ncbi:hypothetical protein ACFYZB_33600 [Streptomyces sp. NPDC001852]|uniref:hypothetical protein n=1 Tax=Streptomyces sp. NPDC001852 TaxID=3364619 RepID=UPI0036CB26CC